MQQVSRFYAEASGNSKKNGMDGKRKMWRKLHFALDTNTHDIIDAELRLSTVTDAEVLPNLLKQTRRTIQQLSCDDTYETRDCHVVIRFKRAVDLIPPGRELHSGNEVLQET